MRSAPYFKETWLKVEEELKEYEGNKSGNAKIEIISDEELK